MLKYCINCLIPDSKPDISFDEHGVCKACTNFFNRKSIDWDSRKRSCKKFWGNIKIEVNQIGIVSFP